MFLGAGLDVFFRIESFFVALPILGLGPGAARDRARRLWFCPSSPFAQWFAFARFALLQVVTTTVGIARIATRWTVALARSEHLSVLAGCCVTLTPFTPLGRRAN